LTATDNRNNYAFKATNTAATADQSAVSAVERYEQSDSRNSKDQKTLLHQYSFASIFLFCLYQYLMSYVSKSKSTAIQAVQEEQLIERQKLAEVRQALDLSKKELQKKYPQIAFKD
jgi:hypothetical protein